MPKVRLAKFEEELDREAQADSLIKRWKKSAMKDGRVHDYMKHEAFLPKSLRKKEKQKEAKIRRIKHSKKRKF